MHSEQISRSAKLAVLVAALGYFVDIYDLLLFSIVRVASLKSLGVPEDELLSQGVFLINIQMAGLLIGGVLWGVLGDLRGRLSVLFGSIFLYSIANVLNGFVETIPQYAFLRFIAGIGLAGELGAGITLVCELMPKSKRGYGTMIVASVGIMGAVAAALVGDLFPWRTAYIIGGAMGLLLLALRVGVTESGIFHQVKAQAHVSRGNFLLLFTNASRAKRYLSVIAIGVPIWFVVGIPITFAPEFGRHFGLAEIPSAGTAVLFNYLGLAFGDLLSGWVSQLLQSRKKVVTIFLVMMAVAYGAFTIFGGASTVIYYAFCFVMGVAAGYWAIFVTIASEQFGTNLRATATTTVPNFVRGAVIPVTMSFELLRGDAGLLSAATIVGAVTWCIAIAALMGLEETFKKDLDFLEHKHS